MNALNFFKYAFAAAAVAGAANAYAVEYAELTATITPDPIPAAYTGNVEVVFFLGDTWAGIDYDKTLNVETASGLPYTTAHFKLEMNWSGGDDYYVMTFDKELEEGYYVLDIPQGAIYESDWDTGDHVVENIATQIKFSVGEPQPVEPELPGFKPTEITPTSFGPDYADWTINLTYEQAITVNPDKTPYLMLGDETYLADLFVNSAFINKPKQLILGFDGMSERPNGTYTLVIPEGALTYENGDTNALYTYKYEWTGGKTTGGNDPVGDLKIASAYIGDISIMTQGVVVPNIPAENCYFTTEVLPAEIEAVGVRLLDVTGFEVSEWASAEAIWVNIIESKNAEGLFSKEIYSIEGITLTEGHTYVAELSLYDVYQLPIMNVAGTLYTETFTGSTEAFRYSDVEIVSIVPEPGSEFKIGDKMVVTYSAPVNLVAGEGKSGFGKGNAGWADFSTMSASADRTVWTITFPNSEINAAAGPNQISPRLWGTDENGLQLRPAEYDIPSGTPEEGLTVFNGGYEKSSYTQVNYSGYAKCPVVTVSPLETEELTAIDFSIAGGKELNPSYLADFPEIKNEAGEVVALVFVDGYEADGGHIVVTSSTGTSENMSVTGLQAPLNNPITTPGTYTLELPWNLFVVGREFDSFGSAPGTYTIVVTGAKAPANEQLTFTSNDAQAIKAEFIPGEDDEPAYYMVTFETKQETADVTIDIPEGYDGMYYMDMTPAFSKRVSGTELEAEGFKKGNVITVDADGKTHNYVVVLAKDDEADMDTAINVVIKADMTTGILTIESEGNAAYYTIDGVKVATPEKGLYIKVTNGKASKVVL